MRFFKHKIAILLTATLFLSGCESLYNSGGLNSVVNSVDYSVAEPMIKTEFTGKLFEKPNPNTVSCLSSDACGISGKCVNKAGSNQGICMIAVDLTVIKKHSLEAKHIYEDVIISEPTKVKKCHFIEVPVYSNTPALPPSGEEVVTGMLLGGLVGKAVTGNDKVALGGAVIGGAITATPRKGKRILLGHTKKETCSIKNTFKWVTKKEYSHSLIKYITSDGSTYQVEAKVIGIK